MKDRQYPNWEVKKLRHLFAVLPLLFVIWSVACQPSQGSLPTLTSVEQVRNLKPDEANRAYPVRLRGVVTYYSPTSKLLVIQDSSGGIRVDISGMNISTYSGELVQLEGFTESGDHVPVIIRPALEMIDPGQLPDPWPVSLKDLASGKEEYRWVEAQGIVRSATVEHDGSLALNVFTDDGQFKASVSDYDGFEYSSIVHAKVRVHGVAHTIFNVKREVIRYQLLVPMHTNVLVDKPAPSTPEQASLQPRSLPVLTNVEQVRKLTSQEAKRRYPVRLRAVVTYYDPAWAIMFVQDSTGGIYVNANGVKEFAVKSGQLVEVEGLSDPGDFAPQIINPSVRLIGPGSMPTDPRASLEHLFTGHLDSQWVEVEGIVQSVSDENDHLLLDITSGLYRFKAHSADLSNRALLAQLVDAKVRVRGPCGTLFNRKRQLVGIQVYVPDLSYISIEKLGLADPFSIPVQPIVSLLQFFPNEDAGHRIKVQGTVTLQRSRGLFIKDETGGLFVQARETTPVEPGDQVEVVGFPISGQYTPILQDAIYRKVGKEPPPTPVTVTAEEALMGNYDAHLVKLEAYLLDRVVSSTEQVLTLQAGKFVFNAHLEELRAGDSLASLRNGSLLQLTGICSVQVDSSRSPMIPLSFQILLRSPGDIIVLENAPWWTLKHTLWTGAIMMVIILASLTWVVMLRLRVGSQTEIIRLKLEREAALEQRYRELFENANDMVYTQDLVGNFTSINKAGEHISGYTREEVLKMNITQIVKSGHQQLYRQMMGWKSGGEVLSVYELEIMAKDGRRLTLEVSSRPIYQDGKPIEVESIAREITERKQAEEKQARLQAAIQRAANEWQMTFDAIESPVLILDMAGRVKRMNQAAQELSGRSYEESVGQPVEEIATGQPWWKAAEIVSLIQEDFSTGSYQVKDGLSGKTWEMAVSLFRGPEATDRWIILVARDITRMVELQESLRKNETMSAMGQLVAGMAHEVRNPLFAISANLDAFEDCSGDQQEHEQTIEVLRQGLNRLSKLMQVLLEYGKPAKPELVPGPVEEVIAEAVSSCEPLAERMRVRIRNNIKNTLGPMKMDRGRLMQVFRNLLENAIQHSPRDGNVTVVAEQIQQNGQGWIECVVKDCGPGFRAEDLPNIFDPFFTRRRGGTGLGLSIVQRIVEEHGGKVSATNSAEGGAVVTVRIPSIQH